MVINRIRLQGLVALLGLWWMAGCATVFSGSRQTVTIDTVPPGGTVIVVGGTTGAAILKVKKATAVNQAILALLDPHMAPAAREELKLLDIDELVTRLVLWLKLDQAPPGFLAPGGVPVKIPQPVIDQVVSLLGLETVGTAPLTLTLKRGKPYAVIAWTRDHKARVVGITPRFNWVVMWNVFNLFLGVPIDLLTGSWSRLSPSRVNVTMEALALPAATM